jgi:Baseplate J-like protein
MSGTDRLATLCEQNAVTGIDFIQIVDPETQMLLRVFFLIDPDDVVPAWVVIPPLPAPQEAPFDRTAVRILNVTGGASVAEVKVTAARFVRGTFASQERVVLEIGTAQPGDFSIYTLHIDSNWLDPFFNDVEFSFKQGCPSRFDCREKESPCPDEALVDFPVDYLARDFTSIRLALLDFAAQRYPGWRERLEADAGVMLSELMAALGDEFAYVQDRYARESHFESATQRRSLRWHTLLVDYPIHEGLSATTLLSIQAIAGGHFVNAGTRVWGSTDDGSAIPFEIGEGLRDVRRFWVHEAWNAIPAYLPDGSQPCLSIGSTQIFLSGHFPESAQQPLPADVHAKDDGGDWAGRLLVLRSLPDDPSVPERNHLVHVTEVEQLEDALVLTSGVPTPYTRIAWDASEALPFELFLPSTTALANIVPATAGETFTEFFRIGRNVASSEDIAVAVEREGICNELTEVRAVTYLHSLTATEARGLGWRGELRKAAPEIELLEADPVTRLPFTPEREWIFFPSLLDAASQDRAFTLENGAWKTVFEVERFGRFVRHVDYASQAGFTLRFGDGEFGMLPPDQAVFRARYRTGAGTIGNLPKDTVTLIADPNPTIPPAPTLAGIANRVTNPFAITTGVDPERADSAKQLAPEAFRAETLRAVRDEDYRAHAERVTGVQQAGAKARWTGSWLSEFVTVDPAGGFSLSAKLRAEVQRVLDGVRQVGREVFVRDPRYLNLDLEIEICVQPSAYSGQVQERVVEALTIRRPGLSEPNPFFHPDNFTFGTPLYRADLEAAVQAVPGVLAVEEIRLRVRGVTDWTVFEENLFAVSDDQILRLQNDPRFPDHGSLRIRAH